MKDSNYIRQKSTFSEYGFTLIELMVAMALGLLVTAISYGIYISVQRSSSSQDQVSEIQSTSMITLDLLSKDIKETGFGVPRFFDDINDRTKVMSYNDNTGTYNSDRLLLLGGYRQIATLKKAATIGDSTIEFEYLPGITVVFDVEKGKNHVSIMGLQYLKATDVGTDTLTFSGASINKNFPIDAPIYLVEDLTYWIQEEDSKGVLKKSGRFGMPLTTYDIADNIDDMQVVGFDQNNDKKFERLQVFLLSKTDRPDLNYQDRGHDLKFDEATHQWSLTNNSDSYRRRLLSLSACFRNDI